MELSERVAIVTGGSRGIGEAIVRLLVSKGATAIIADVDYAAAQSLASEIQESGGSAMAVEVDVQSLTSCEAMVQAVLDSFGRIDILVNNAGITRDTLLMRMSEEDWDKVISVNLKGVYNCTKAAIRAILKARPSRIVNVASVVGITGNIGQSNYAASKAGVIGFTKSMARELAGRGITVNAVAPGFIKTKMTENLPEKVIERLNSQIPLNTLGEPGDVAEAVVFLCSNGARYITGQVINVDGGMIM
jgi:3-oxoacyl-[acyl-carrier protein] reductase